MYIEQLHLQITRNCTLECEHCLRGNRQHININPIIIDKIFEDIKEIKSLLLTGGEPLIAIEVLEHLVKIIKTKDIKINKIYIVTNGTVLSPRIINVLKEFNSFSKLDLKVSNDIFHQTELINKNLLDLRNENYERLKLRFDNVREYGKETYCYTKIALAKRGNAKNLTDERLQEFNKKANQTYVIDNSLYENDYPITLENDIVTGKITIDVFGNLVEPDLSYEEEDMIGYETGINVMTMPFKEAIESFIKYHDDKSKQKVLKI